MGSELENRLNDDEYKNWLKVSFALIQSKEALHDFTKDVIEKVHQDILTKTGGSRCDGTCKTNKGKIPNCASCSKWVTEIKAYNKGMLNWKNTEPTIWHETPWEIAKCFMNPQGSKTTATLNTGPEKTDLSGILNVLVNCKEFGRSYLKEKKQPENVREIRNKVMHCPTMTFPEKDMKSFIDSIIALLEDELSLKNLKVCKEKVEIIKSLRDGDFQILLEVEVECIEGSLRTHELLLESGDEVSPETRVALDNFSNWIKHNKDLETRFDLKLNNISDHLKNVTDHFDARMSTVEFSCGELKGKIEYMASRMSELEKNCGVVANLAATSTGIQHDKSLMKNSLQCYAQKKKLDLPKYTHEATATGQFFSKVSVAGKSFSSEGAKSTKKEAEQSAAEVALKSFINESTDDCKENDFSPSPSNLPTTKNPIVLPKVQTGNKKSYKNQLQECAQEQKILNPLYESKRTEGGLFLSKVFFDGVWYSPDTLPQGRKIDAEQKAAEFVLAYLENNSTSLPQPGNESSSNSSCTETSTSMVKATSPKSTEKTYKSILNEHVQKMSGTPLDYMTEKCENKFLCSVKVSGMTYKSPQAMNSIKEAKESAAMEACSQLNLLKDQTCQSDCFSTLNHNSADSSSSSSITATKDVCCKSSVTSVLTDADSQSCTKLSEVSTSELGDSPDGKKPFKSKLHEHVQQLGIDEHLDYEEIKCESGFLSQVKLMGKTYKSQAPQPTKKAAKEMAAKEAWNDITRSTPEKLTSSVSNGTTMLPSSNDDSLSTGSSADTVRELPSSIITTTSTTGNVDRDDTQAGSSSSNTSPPIELHFADEDKRPYRSKLNEYVQSSGSDVPPEYKDESDDFGYWSKVVVMGKTYKSSSPQKSKKEARDNAAKQAYTFLVLGQSSCDGVSLASALSSTKCALASGEGAVLHVNHQNETSLQREGVEIQNKVIGLNATDNTIDQDVGIENQGIQAEAQPAPIKSNFRVLLAEHVKQSKIVPTYITQQAPETKEFFSKVYLGKRCFKGEKAKKKKDAEQNAAKDALEERKGCNCKSTDHCQKMLKEYQKKLNVSAEFPKYEEATHTDGEKFSVVVHVVKEWNINLSEQEPQPRKKDAEEALAKQALKLLEEEKKPIPMTGPTNSKSKLNSFCQRQSNVPPLKYSIDGGQASFYGSLCFYTVEEYESLSPQPSKDKAIERAAMSACNDLCLI